MGILCSTATETLFAQWETEEYTLTIIPNGGTWNGSVSNQTIKGTYNSTREIKQTNSTKWLYSNIK